MKDSSSFSVKLYPSSPRCANWLRLRIKLCQRHQHCYCCVISVSVQNWGLCGLHVVTVFIHIPFSSSITEPCIKRSIEAKDLCREVFIIELFEIFNESLRPVQTKITMPLSAEFAQINPNFHLNCGLRCIAAVCVRLPVAVLLMRPCMSRFHILQVAICPLSISPFSISFSQLSL